MYSWKVNALHRSFELRKRGRPKPSTCSDGQATHSGMELLSSRSGTFFYIQRCRLLVQVEVCDPTEAVRGPLPGFYLLLLSPVSLFPPSEL